MEYQQFLQTKSLVDQPTGFVVEALQIEELFDFQQAIVKWALKRGRSAIFADCGLGKTPMQLEWAYQVSKHIKLPVLILAPLAVAEQTQQEGRKFRIKVNLCQDQDDITNGINITNYEQLHKFDVSCFGGIVLDESGILKNFTGQMRNEIISAFMTTPYKLACTATPAPNDYVELGNHAEFLGVMTRAEMLSLFFINDTSDVGTWRLKKHAESSEFWKWLCSWSVMLSKPSDLGFGDNKNFTLPKLHYHEHIIQTDDENKDGFFINEVCGLGERRKVRSETVDIRCREAASIINRTDDKFVVWCNLNTESETLTSLLQDAKEVTGSQPNEEKAKLMLNFAQGEFPRIVTKPKIAGRGMNWQICNNMVFVGLNDSWEDLYQAVRRIWRFGQTKPVHVHIIIEQREGSVLSNIKRKDKQAQTMMEKMIKYTQDISKAELGKLTRDVSLYQPTMDMQIPKWLVSEE